MAQARKLAAIMAVDVVGYSRLMGEDEAGTAAAVRARREAAAPIVSEKGGRIVKTMGDGLLVEFASVVAAIECAILIQKMMAELNEGVDEGKRIIYRIGVHIGDVLIDGDDILGDGVNIAARLEGDLRAGRRQPFQRRLSPGRGPGRGRVRRPRRKKPQEHCASGARLWLAARGAAPAASPEHYGPPPLSIVVLPFANYRRRAGAGLFRRRRDGEPDNRPFAHARRLRDRPQHGFHLQGQGGRREADRTRAQRALCARRQRAARRRPHARQRAAHRRRERRASVGRALRQADRRPLRHAGRDRRAPRQSASDRAHRHRGAPRPSTR